MKRLSAIVVSSLLAVTILFGSLTSQTSTVHAASVSNSTQNLNALIAEVKVHVHVANHQATIDSQLQSLITPGQFQLVQEAVTTYNMLTASPHNAPPALVLSSTSHMASNKSVSTVHPSDYWSVCIYVSNGTMDTIAWSIIFGGGVLAIAGILIALLPGAQAGGAAIAIAGIILGIGGTYLLWYSDKYWPNGTTWCADSYGGVWYYVD